MDGAHYRADWYLVVNLCVIVKAIFQTIHQRLTKHMGLCLAASVAKGELDTQDA